jgi:hypothetical protein
MDDSTKEKLKLVPSPFGDDGRGKGDACSAVWTAIHACGIENPMGPSGDVHPKEMAYRWLEGTPRTSLVVELVDKLYDLGYVVTKVHAGPLDERDDNTRAVVEEWKKAGFTEETDRPGEYTLLVQPFTLHRVRVYSADNVWMLTGGDYYKLDSSLPEGPAG